MYEKYREKINHAPKIQNDDTIQVKTHPTKYIIIEWKKIIPTLINHLHAESPPTRSLFTESAAKQPTIVEIALKLDARLISSCAP